MDHNPNQSHIGLSDMCDETFREVVELLRGRLNVFTKDKKTVDPAFINALCAAVGALAAASELYEFLLRDTADHFGRGDLAEGAIREMRASGKSVGLASVQNIKRSFEMAKAMGLSTTEEQLTTEQVKTLHNVMKEVKGLSIAAAGDDDGKENS